MEPRPKSYLNTISRRYPGAWKLVSALLAARSKVTSDWPEWCFLPITDGNAILELLASKQAEDEESLESGGTHHASPRPHIRRAHWHAFWTGPKSDAEQRKLNLRWLPPIPVAVKDVDELVPVVRPVKLEAQG